MSSNRMCAALIGVTLSACSFPDVTIVQAPATTSTTSTTATSGSGGSGGAGTGGAGAGTGGAGGAAGTSSGGGIGGGGPCVPGDCSRGPDKDGDGHADPPCDDGTLPSDDCDDCDGDVFPGQTAWFVDPRPTGTYDYNCNQMADFQYLSSDCGGLGCGRSSVFLQLAPVFCGDSARFGDCVAVVAGSVCNQVPEAEPQRQGCH